MKRTITVTYEVGQLELRFGDTVAVPVHTEGGYMGSLIVPFTSNKCALEFIQEEREKAGEQK